MYQLVSRIPKRTEVFIFHNHMIYVGEDKYVFEPQSAADINTLADCRKYISFEPVQRLNSNSYSVFARFVVYNSQSRVYLFETIFSVESVRHAARTPASEHAGFDSEKHRVVKRAARVVSYNFNVRILSCEVYLPGEKAVRRFKLCSITVKHCFCLF